MSLSQTPIFLFLIVTLLVAAVNDIRFRKIPNWLTFPAVIIAVIYHTGVNGLEGFLFSVEGVGVGIALLILPYLMGGVGAGDAKLMAAIGGLLGPKGVFIAFLFTSIVGGIYALVLLVAHGYLRETVKRYWAILRSFILTKSFIYVPPSEKETKLKLRYGAAIALGTLISVAWRVSV